MTLTKNFNKSEFDSKDGDHMPYKVYQNIKILAKQLQKVRNILDKPININSGYRSPEHNKSIGGVKNSQHVFGNAADITIKGLNSYTVYNIMELLINDGVILEGGLGLYDNFVHYDIRGQKIRWDYRKLL